MQRASESRALTISEYRRRYSKSVLLARSVAEVYLFQSHDISGRDMNRFVDFPVGSPSDNIENGILGESIHKPIPPPIVHKNQCPTNTPLLHLLNHLLLLNQIHDLVQLVHHLLHVLYPSLPSLTKTRPIRQHFLRRLRLLEAHRPLHAVHPQPEHALHARLRQRVLRLLLAQLQQLRHAAQRRHRQNRAQHADILRLTAPLVAHMLHHAATQQLPPGLALVAPLRAGEERGVQHRGEHRQRPLQQLGDLEGRQERAVVGEVLPVAAVRAGERVEDLLLLGVVGHQHGEHDEDGDDLAARHVVFFVARQRQKTLVVAVERLEVVVVDVLDDAELHEALEKVLHVLVFEELRVDLLDGERHADPLVDFLAQTDLRSKETRSPTCSKKNSAFSRLDSELQTSTWISWLAAAAPSRSPRLSRMLMSSRISEARSLSKYI